MAAGGQSYYATNEEGYRETLPPESYMYTGKTEDIYEHESYDDDDDDRDDVVEEPCECPFYCFAYLVCLLMITSTAVIIYELVAGSIGSLAGFDSSSAISVIWTASLWVFAIVDTCLAIVGLVGLWFGRGSSKIISSRTSQMATAKVCLFALVVWLGVSAIALIGLTGSGLALGAFTGSTVFYVCIGIYLLIRFFSVFIIIQARNLVYLEANSVSNQLINQVKPPKYLGRELGPPTPIFCCAFALEQAMKVYLVIVFLLAVGAIFYICYSGDCTYGWAFILGDTCQTGIFYTEIVTYGLTIITAFIAFVAISSRGVAREVESHASSEEDVEFVGRSHTWSTTALACFNMVTALRFVVFFVLTSMGLEDARICNIHTDLTVPNWFLHCQGNEVFTLLAVLVIFLIDAYFFYANCILLLSYVVAPKIDEKKFSLGTYGVM